MRRNIVRRGASRLWGTAKDAAWRWRGQANNLLGRLLERRLRACGEIHNDRVPAIINNRDRLTTLVLLVAWLERACFQDIIIIDNDSSYEPLLAYYATTCHRVIRLAANAGHMSLWSLPLFRSIRNNFFVYTDSDIIPTATCPYPVCPHLAAALHRHPGKVKVGLGLLIDDLPEHFDRKQEVIAWESAYWHKQLEPGLYDASVDTTFALYRPRIGGHGWWPSLRTGPPYVARHAPWYVDSRNLSEEERYYQDHASGAFSWWAARSRPPAAEALLNEMKTPGFKHR